MSFIINPYVFPSGGGFTPFVQGLNFRSTAGYVTDGANETYVIGDSYPTTRGGVTFGWESGYSASNRRDRNATADRRLAGVNFDGDGGAIFRFDLPSAGTYAVRLAIGDLSSGGAKGEATIRDDTSILLTLPASSTTSGQFIDTTNTLHTSAANWLANNTAVNCAFTSTILRFYLGTGTYTVAHMQIERVS